jgi:DNA-binding MarR family transcriptional regulator
MLDPLIHQETRLRVTAYLHRNSEALFASLARDLALTDGNLGAHLARLQEAGYVAERAVLTPLGFERRYALTRKGADAFRAYLDELEKLLRA